MRALIVCAGYGGHRLVYVRLIAIALDEAGYAVSIVLTQRGMNSSERATHLHSLPFASFDVLPDERITWRRLRRFALRLRSDLLVLPDGDRWAIRLGFPVILPCNPPTRVLVTQDPAWNTDPDLLRRLRLRVKSLALFLGGHRRGLKILFLSNPADQQSRRHVAPDPVIFEHNLPSQKALRAELNLSQVQFWFVLAGFIDRRKNLPLILQAMLRANLKNTGLYVAGEIDPTVMAESLHHLDEVRAAGMEVRLENRLHSNTELNRAIVAGDAVIVAYSTDSPNSMMTKGVRAGRVVVVAGSRSLRRWAHQLDIPLVGELTVASLAELLETAREAPTPPPDLSLNSEDFGRAFL